MNFIGGDYGGFSVKGELAHSWHFHGDLVFAGRLHGNTAFWLCQLLSIDCDLLGSAGKWFDLN